MDRPVVAHLQRAGSKRAPAAGLARRDDVGQEATSRARSRPALRRPGSGRRRRAVEREARRGEAAHLAPRACAAKSLRMLVPDAEERRRHRARRAADGRLIDGQRARDQASTPRERRRTGPARRRHEPERLAQRRVEHLAHQRALARAATRRRRPCSRPTRDAQVDALAGCCARAPVSSIQRSASARPAARGAPRGSRERARRWASPGREHLARRALGHDAPAAAAAARARGRSGDRRRGWCRRRARPPAPSSPVSTSARRLPSSRCVSRGCRPMVGSSSTYSAPVSPRRAARRAAGAASRRRRACRARGRATGSRGPPRSRNSQAPQRAPCRGGSAMRAAIARRSCQLRTRSSARVDRAAATTSW